MSRYSILACNGLDKPEGCVARELALEAAAAVGAELVCPVLLNRAPARYRKLLDETELVVVDGCATRCASRLAIQAATPVGRRVLVSDALKATGRSLDCSLRLGPGDLDLARDLARRLVADLAKPEPEAPPSGAPEFEPPSEFLTVAHDKFEFRFPAVDYWFNENDVWVRIEDGVARIGLSDYLQQRMTDIYLFEPPETGARVEAFGELGTVESAKAAFEVIAPAGGQILAINLAVVANPGLVNEDPYGAGWLVEMRLADWGQDLALLLDPAAYAETVRRKAAEE